MSVAENELFDGTEYEIPFAKADGKEVTALALNLSGSLRLNRNDPGHVALIESLTLGRIVQLSVMAGVSGKGQQVREGSDGNEVVTHTVSLKLHEVSQ